MRRPRDIDEPRLPATEAGGTGDAPISAAGGTTFFVVALLMLVGTRISPSLARLLYQLSATLCVLAAAFLAAAFTSEARQRGVRPASPDAPASPQAFKSLRGVYAACHATLRSVDWRGDWLPVAAAIVPSVLAVFLASKAWRMVALQPSALADAWIAVLLIVAAFPALVYERHLAAMPPWRSPEAASLSRVLRVPILAFLLLGIAAVLRWLGLSYWVWIERLVDIVVGIVGLELILRSLACLFLPFAPLPSRRSHAESFFAGLIRAQRPDLAALNAAINERFGIDFTQSWALRFVRRATLPVLCAMALLCWLLTGVTALGISERAVYEAFGKPRAVLGPGLHLHLPWPLGLLRPVEFGVVHEIAIVPATAGAAQAAASAQASGTAAIEGEAPPSADRLWTTDHPSEASYLVASLGNGRQSFEVANIDLRIVYRIALSDAAALDVVYHVASPEDAIRSTAGQMLARYFARYTIADVLGQNRDAFIRGFEQELQARLTSLDTGIEVMAVIVEAIHPPSGAAASYQGVQAAAIRAQAAIATARAAAVTLTSSAQEEAVRTHNTAAATAVERVDQARAALSLFAGDHRAHVAGGEAFLFERRLEHVDKGLAGMPLVIIDHRITHDDALTLDVRPLSSSKPTDVPEEP